MYTKSRVHATRHVVKKFQFIWRNIYAVTPQEGSEEQGDTLDEDPSEDECRVWSRKAQPFIDLLNRVSKMVCRWPSFKVSIDEMMTRFKGRSGETYLPYEEKAYQKWLQVFRTVLRQHRFRVAHYPPRSCVRHQADRLRCVRPVLEVDQNSARTRCNQHQEVRCRCRQLLYVSGCPERVS